MPNGLVKAPPRHRPRKWSVEAKLGWSWTSCSRCFLKHLDGVPGRRYRCELRACLRWVQSSPMLSGNEALMLETAATVVLAAAATVRYCTMSSHWSRPLRSCHCIIWPFLTPMARRECQYLCRQKRQPSRVSGDSGRCCRLGTQGGPVSTLHARVPVTAAPPNASPPPRDNRRPV